MIVPPRAPGPLCPTPERLASYLDGAATPIERTEIESHVATCEDCYFVLAESMRAGRRQKAVPARAADLGAAPVARMKWMGVGAAIAAAVMLTIRVAGPGRVPQTNGQIAVSTPPPAPSPSPSNLRPATPQLEALVAALTALEASTGEFRSVEPRLAGVSHYRPMKPVTRSASVDDRGEAVRNAAEAVASLAAASPRDATTERALARMYLAAGIPDRAVEILEPAAATTPDAGLLTDLTAGYLARGGPGDGARGRATAERAVHADPRHPEAWFNLALAAETLDNPGRATEAWQRFLQLDSTSGWADEARRHLERLKKRTGG